MGEILVFVASVLYLLFTIAILVKVVKEQSWSIGLKVILIILLLAPFLGWIAYCIAKVTSKRKVV